jgi:hypothetical protein
MNNDIIYGSLASVVWIGSVFWYIGFKELRECCGLWLTTSYWSIVNIVEFASLAIKSIIIIAGLLFHYSPFYLWFPNMFTSWFLIWVSNKKGLPTLVWFHAIWVWLSCIIIVQKFL